MHRDARRPDPAGAPDPALVFSCAGRHAMLGTWVERELPQERVGRDVPTTGFYSYGEFCPLPSSPTARTHGNTFVTVLIGERQ